MLETVARGFKNARNRLRGYREITESNIEDALGDIRRSLLEADVEFNVVKAFLAQVKEKALGEIVLTRATKDGQALQVTPGDHFIKICHDELEAIMGAETTGVDLAPSGPTRIMMVGLQGSGKTTTAGKLANFIRREHKKKVCLVAADIYRPAAVDQLRVLGQKLDFPVFHEPGISPPEICARALPFAKQHDCDVIIFDTAGRLAIDDTLMTELEEIQRRTDPHQIYFVCDAMIGQDAVRTAAEFNRRLELDGVILTKLDGDARGGAALSIRHVTGKPIRFVGMGEAMDKLEPFRPDGLASRILGLGDIVGLMRDFEEVVDEKKAEEDAARLLSGQFDMTHFLEQIRTIRKMGPLKEVMERLPMFGEMLPEGANVDERELVRVEALINSMTRAERSQPEIINEGRARRIAKGSGMKVTDVQSLLERFFGMRQMMGAIGQQPGLLGRLPGFKQLAQLKNLKNLNMGDLFSGMGGMGGGMGGGLPALGAGGGGFGGMGPNGPTIPRSLLRQAQALKRAGQTLPREVEEALAMAKDLRPVAPERPTRVDPDVKKDRRKKEKLAKAARKKARKGK